MSGNISDFTKARKNRMIEEGELDGQILINVFVVNEDEGSIIFEYDSDYSREDLTYLLEVMLKVLKVQE